MPISALNLKSIHVPEYPVAGEPADLECCFDLEEDKLYSVTWYRDDKEFFKYAPKAANKIKTFNMTGLLIDVSKAILNAFIF